jgi:hypothetical protein
MGSAAALIGTGAGIASNAIIPGSGAIVGPVAGLISNLFGGGSKGDSSTVAQERETRVSWTYQQAVQGSPLAAALIMAGAANDPTYASYWNSALQQLAQSNPDVLAAARATYPAGYWPVGQPDFYTDVTGETHTQVLTEVLQAGGTQLASSTSLSPMLTTAGYNYTPLLIAGGLGLAALLIFNGRRRR